MQFQLKNLWERGKELRTEEDMDGERLKQLLGGGKEEERMNLEQRRDNKEK